MGFRELWGAVSEGETQDLNPPEEGDLTKNEADLRKLLEGARIITPTEAAELSGRSYTPKIKLDPSSSEDGLRALTYIVSGVLAGDEEAIKRVQFTNIETEFLESNPVNEDVQLYTPIPMRGLLLGARDLLRDAGINPDGDAGLAITPRNRAVKEVFQGFKNRGWILGVLYPDLQDMPVLELCPAPVPRDNPPSNESPEVDLEVLKGSLKKDAYRDIFKKS